MCMGTCMRWLSENSLVGSVFSFPVDVGSRVELRLSDWWVRVSPTQRFAIPEMKRHPKALRMEFFTFASI